ncbi:MAG TPA: hypothetical protein VHX63_14675 [Acidobacteriaceae bacterium]|jgi:hypothetical protein|nr:hypothetical protein [Acidobacteriaceae bacterium]
MSQSNVLFPSLPFARRVSRQLREHEVLRVSADISGDDQQKAAIEAREQVLRWAENKVIGEFDSKAWEQKDFEHFTSGRTCAAVRWQDTAEDIWCLRIEDPDKTVAGRTWTTEVTTVLPSSNQSPTVTLRLLVGTPEEFLSIEPHVPGVVRQLISKPGLMAGAYKLVDRPVVVHSKKSVELLIDALVDPNRKLPIIALSVPSGSANPSQPLLDAKTLAEACAGLAITVIIPAEYSWHLTERFGKQLSVYEGAARVYLPGFTEDANPFGGHELILPTRFSTPTAASASLTRLRWIAANGSVRRLALGKDVLAFASLKGRELAQRQAQLELVGATDREQLEAARERLGLMDRQVREAENYQQQFSDLHAAAEYRSESAEAQLRAASFRIQQLLAEIKTSGSEPDAKLALPQKWDDFVNWCDLNLAGRVLLAPQARRALKDGTFEDIALAAKCLLWLANEYRDAKTGDSDGTLRDRVITPGVINAHCGADAFQINWQGKTPEVEWHIKNGGNTRDPARCLRIYYFWDDSSQQVVIAYMPAHIHTDAS